QLLANLYRLSARLPAQAHQFAGGAIVAHDTIELGDTGEGGLRSSIGRFLVRCVDNQLEPCTHVRFDESEPGQRCRALLLAPRGEGRKKASPVRPNKKVLHHMILSRFVELSALWSIHQ